MKDQSIAKDQNVDHSAGLHERVRSVCAAVSTFPDSIRRLQRCRELGGMEPRLLSGLLKALGTTETIMSSVFTKYGHLHRHSDPFALNGQRQERPAGPESEIKEAIERVRSDLEYFLDGVSTKVLNRASLKGYQPPARERLLALSSSPRWTILHEHRFQMHRDIRKNQTAGHSSQLAPTGSTSAPSATAIMDIFLTQEADLVQRLNNMCNDMEMTIENMSKRLGEKNGDMPAKKERVATMNAEKAVAESIEAISRRLSDLATTVSQFCRDTGVNENGFLRFDEWFLFLIMLDVPLQDEKSSAIFNHLAGKELLNRGAIPISALERLVETYDREATVEADVVQKPKPKQLFRKTGSTSSKSEEVSNESDDKAAVLTIRLQECPNSFVQKHRRGLIMNMQKNAITFKSTTHPYETLSEEEKSLAETCVTEHIVARKAQNVARYVKKRKNFLQKNVQLQQAYMKSRQREHEHTSEQERKRLSFLRDKERMLNELRKRTRYISRCDDINNVKSKEAFSREKEQNSMNLCTVRDTVDQRVVDRMGRYFHTPFFHENMTKEQRQSQLKAVEIQQARVVRRKLLTGQKEKSGGKKADTVLSDIRLASCVYALRVHLEGGGIDPIAEDERTNIRLRASAVVFQRIWRRHLFHNYLWARNYLCDTHHVYQLFERCIPVSKSLGLRPMEQLSFVHDAIPNVKDRRHCHALRPPVDDDRIVADVALVTKLLVEVNLPLSVDKMRQEIIALELKIKNSGKAKNGSRKDDEAIAVQKASDTTEKSLPGSIGNTPHTSAKQRVDVPFLIFKAWWVKLIPPPFDATTMVRVVKAAKQQHAREIRAAEDEDQRVRAFHDAPLISKFARLKQSHEDSFKDLKRRTMREICDHADAAYAQRQTISKLQEHHKKHRPKEHRTVKYKPEDSSEEDALNMYRVIYDDKILQPGSDQSHELLSKAKSLHHLKRCLQKHRTAVVGLSQQDHDTHVRSHDHSRGFRKGSSDIIQKRHQAIGTAVMGSSTVETFDKSISVRSAPNMVDGGRALRKDIAAILDPQHFDAFHPHHLRSSKFEKLRKAQELQRTQSESRIEALGNAAMHKQRSLALLRVHRDINVARTIAAAEAGNWAAAAENLPLGNKISLNRKYSQELSYFEVSPQTEFEKAGSFRRRKGQQRSKTAKTSFSWKNELDEAINRGLDGLASSSDFDVWGKIHRKY